MNKKFIISTFIRSLITLMTFLFCTLIGAFVMLFIHYQENDDKVFIIKIVIALLLLVAKTVFTFRMKGPNPLSTRFVVIYTIDVIGLLLVMFIAHNIITYIIILSSWVLLALLSAILLYRFMQKMKNDNPEFQKLFSMFTQKPGSVILGDLNEVSDEELLEHVYLYVADKMGSKNGAEEEATLTEFDEYIQKVYVIENLNNEVANGGFEQYFFNSSGYLVYEAVSILKELGMEDAATILSIAIKAINPEDLVITEYKEKQINRSLFKYSENEDLSKKLDELSDTYYTFVEAIQNRLIEEVRKNTKHEEEINEE